MTRMKALLGVVLCIALVLSLSITAFAANEKIRLLNPLDDTVEYEVYKIFDVSGSGNNLVYKIPTDATDEQVAFLKEHQNETGLIVNDDETITKTNQFDAAKFAKWLATNKGSIYTLHINTTTPVPSATMAAGYPVNTTGYFYVEYTNGEPYVLTTVLENQTVTIENKKDMPFEKEVDVGNHTSVNVGDTLTYTITGVVPADAAATGESHYYYKVWDKLGAGLVLNSAVTVEITAKTGGADITPTLTTYTDANLTNPVTTIPVNGLYTNSQSTYTDAAPTFVVYMDLAGLEAGSEITITYSAKVVTDIGVLENTAHLVTENYNKDAKTENYTSEIVIDKYENGNAYQKLAGAEFKLMNNRVEADGTDDADKGKWYAVYVGTTKQTSITKGFDWATVTSVDWVAEADATTFVTGDDGSVVIGGLKDGAYQLKETKAPDGYVALVDPIDIEVNGAGSLDSNNIVKNNTAETTENQNHYLKNVSHVANTPGSVLPSTGGRGTTMLYMAGLGMMLAAGAFLIFRRRAEAGK